MISLSHPMPRLTPDMHARVLGCLAQPCGGYGCSGGTATLTKRRIRNQTVQIHLQCNGCGRSISGALARSEHFGWQDYAEWDVEHEQRQEAERAERLANAEQQNIENQDAFERRKEAYRQRSIEYERWCRTSPEWGRMRWLVCRRAGFLCEACLDGPIQQVHHLTYEFGRLPPAWHLRGVCLPCHRRLHADRNGWRDDWCQGAPC